MMSGSLQTYGSTSWGMSDAPSHMSASYHSGPSPAWNAQQVHAHAQAQNDKVSGSLVPWEVVRFLHGYSCEASQRLRTMEHLDPQTLFSFPLSAPSRAFHTSSSPFAYDYGHGSSSNSNSTYTDRNMNTNANVNTQVSRRDRAHPEAMDGSYSYTYSNDPDLCAWEAVIQHPRSPADPFCIRPVQFDDF